MAYITANSEVKALTGFTQDYSTSTSPLLTQVELIIGIIESEVEGGLETAGISTPITATKLINYIKKYLAMGSAGLVLQRYGKNDNEFRQADWYYGKYEEWMNKILTDEEYKKLIKTLYSSNYTGIYISSNATDGSHDVAEAEIDEIKYFEWVK